MYGVTDLLCDCRGCETDAGRRPAAQAIRSRRPKCHATACKSVETESRPTFRHSHGTLGVANEWPSSRVDGQHRGLAAATITQEVSYAIQCIRRRVLTYLVVVAPTAAAFATAAMLLSSEVKATAWLPTCDVISARQWSYPVSARLQTVHLPDKTTVWRR